VQLEAFVPVAWRKNQSENLSEAEVIQAATGNLLTFMISALNRAAEQKIDEEGEWEMGSGTGG